MFKDTIKPFILVLLICLDCYFAWFFNNWRNDFYTSIQYLHYQQFVHLLIIFTVIAFSSLVSYGYRLYVASLWGLQWRVKLNNQYAVNSVNTPKIANTAQRVTDDFRAYPNQAITLGMGLLSSCLQVVLFTIIIVSLLPWYFVILPIVWSVFGLYITHKIGYKLVNMSYDNQQLEASYRSSLTLKENGGIICPTKFCIKDIIANYLAIFKKTKYMNFFQNGHSQFSVILPFIVLAPMYFTKAITFGLLMQLSNAFNALTDNLGYLMNSYGDIVAYQACKQRVEEVIE